MSRVRVKEVIVVEGRYDKNTLSQLVDATILCTDGFGIFRDQEKQALLRRLAERQGLILLTDPDGAGQVIRGFLRGLAPPERVKDAYIPDIPGKERRKNAPSREGKLGVEGMSRETLLAALRRAGATLEETADGGPTGDGLDPLPAGSAEGQITKADMFRLGLSGGTGSARRRKMLQRRLSLPERLPPNQLLRVLNLLTTRAELETLLLELVQEESQSHGTQQ